MERQVGSFVWDLRKEAVNIQKHGVDFGTAARAFKDPHRKMFVDQQHSKTEERSFCIGKVAGRILTVRFTYRAGLVRIYGAAYWRKGRRYYEAQDA